MAIGRQNNFYRVNSSENLAAGTSTGTISTGSSPSSDDYCSGNSIRSSGKSQGARN